MKKMIAITLVSLLLLTGCGSQAQSATAPAAPQEETVSAPVQEGQRLHLTVVPEEGSLEAFPMPQGTEKTYGDITYAGVKDVRMQLVR
ncbi:secreted protein, partial [gut metagenome]